MRYKMPQLLDLRVWDEAIEEPQPLEHPKPANRICIHPTLKHRAKMRERRVAI